MIRNSFEKGPQSWCSYDYHASMVNGGTNVFIQATWVPQGGVDNSGYIWTDNTRWSADTPERPLSILPLLFYQNWIDGDPVDLRNTELSVFLRGEGLNLDGARCFFWVHANHTRWHCTGQPLNISNGDWSGEPERVPLSSDETLWHLSWSGAKEPATLDTALGGALSYGFSFVGFTAEVSGRLCMDDFAIERS